HDPVIPGHVAVMLVDLAVPLLPSEELATGYSKPTNEALGDDLGLVGPDADEVYDLVTYVRGNPATSQSSPSSFFSLMCSSLISAITSSLRASFAFSAVTSASSCFSRELFVAADAAPPTALSAFSKNARCQL